MSCLQQPITRWPLLVFLGGATFGLLASSSCHFPSCYSKLHSYIILRLDYAGIAVLIATSFYPRVYYTFVCKPFFKNMYLDIITLEGVATILAFMLPVFQHPKFRTFRASLFFGMRVSGIAPILHTVILYMDDELSFFGHGFPSLRQLNVSGCYRVGDVRITAISKSCPFLIDLDVSVCQNAGDRWDSLAGAGFAIYDPDDNLILKLWKPLGLDLSRAVAEYSALKEGLMAAYDLGIRNVSGLGIVLFTITQPGALTTVSWQSNYHVPFGPADVFVRLSIQPRAECT